MKNTIRFQPLLTLSFLVAAAVSLGPLVPADADDGLPVFPGSKLDAPNAANGMKIPECGHTMTMYRNYTVPKGVAEKSVEAWYARTLRGASFVGGADGSVAGSGTFITADGAGGVIVLQAMASSVSASAIGADRIGVGFMKYDPPLTPDLISALVKAGRGDQTDVNELKKMCPKT